MTFRKNGGVNGGGGGVSGGVRTFFAYIVQNPWAKTSDIVPALNIPQRTLERLLKKLKAEQKIVFRGAPKTGGYFVRREENP